jgi:hypothetical protein
MVLGAVPPPGVNSKLLAACVCVLCAWVECKLLATSVCTVHGLNASCWLRVCVYVCACVRACVHVCVRACVCVCSVHGLDATCWLRMCVLYMWVSGPLCNRYAGCLGACSDRARGRGGWRNPKLVMCLLVSVLLLRRLLSALVTAIDLFYLTRFISLDGFDLIHFT